MINKSNIHPIANSVVVLIMLVFGLYYCLGKKEDKIVYVDNIKLFNNFNMTKDIKLVEETKIKKQGKILDSLYAIFENSKNKEDNAFKNLQQQIAYKSKAFQELQDNYSHNLSNNVWARLNSYIKDYALIHNLKVILGTNGNGNVMYGEASINITTKILEFSNRKYEGNN
ncbi:OmpH family outer membrane protein [uncultured Algibacter sp.]|uniref:OmpH family outer membrane protein n=1 Tax=uncultured Algibacter sp. TaxID=298659 RepID=UPI0032179CCD